MNVMVKDHIAAQIGLKCHYYIHVHVCAYFEK